MASYYGYWGKAHPREGAAPCHLLAFHSLDVAAVGHALFAADRALAARLARAAGATEESVRALIPFLLALHDLGKFAPPFQDLKPELVLRLQGERRRNPYTQHHSAMGLTLWSERVEQVATDRRWLAVETPDGPVDAADASWVFRPWLHSVLAHHGQPVEDDGALGTYFPAASGAREAAAAFVTDVAALLRPAPLRFVQPVPESHFEKILQRSSWLTAGIAVLCDWLGSSDDVFEYRDTALPLAEYWPQALERAERALADSGVLPSRANGYGGLRRLFPDVAEPRPLQAAAEIVPVSGEPQLFVIEDLTGSGKTEAAMVLAHRLMASGAAGGLFFALPTMATANAMYDRLQSVVAALYAEGERPSVVLAHSAPELARLRDLALPDATGETVYGRNEPDISAQCSAWIRDRRKRALLAQVGVGTIDQALLAAMQVKHGTLRLLGLHRNVLVVDEVHAYDAYMAKHLESLLEFQAGLGGSAILLSATLPTEQRGRLTKAFLRGLGRGEHAPLGAAYPLLTRVDAAGVAELPVTTPEANRRRVGVTTLSSEAEAAEFVAQAVADGRNVCWIRNTVQDAIDAHAALAGRLDTEHLTLFHARFAMGDRLCIERRVVGAFGKHAAGSRGTGHAVVATQVVEQSLDLDFDELVTDLAPIDLVIQRAGRLHRRTREGRGNPVLRVLAPPFSQTPPKNWYAALFPRAAHVYADAGQLWLTLRELLARGALVLPEDARSLMDAVFSDAAKGDIPEALQAASAEADVARKAQGAVAQMVAATFALGYSGGGAWESDAHAPTRLGEPTTTVRLARADAAGEAGPWFAHDEHAGELSQVTVPRRRLAAGAQADRAVVSVLEATMRFAGEGTVTLVLREVEGGWVGYGQDVRGNAVKARYDEVVGLRLEREG